MHNTGIQKKQRDIGPELLRIMAMVMIVFSHISTHGDITTDVMCFNRIFLDLLSMGGKIGVNMFILITGYYSIRSGSTVRKAMILIAQTLFYSVSLYLFSCLVGANDLRVKFIFYALIPFVSNKGYWFITIYMLLYCLIPFINGGLEKISRKQHLFLIFLFFLVWAVLPDTYGAFFSTQGYGVSTLCWFVFAYCVGAYLRMYSIKISCRRGLCALLLAVVAMIMAASRILLDLGIAPEGRAGAVLKTMLSFFCESSLYGPFAFVLAVLFLLFFLQIKGKPNKLIYLVSGSVFGIYLIHDSEWIRRFLWDDVFQLSRFGNSRFLPIDLLVVMLLTFTVCGMIDILRKYLLEKPLFNSGIYAKFENKLCFVFAWLFERLKSL